MIGSFLTVVARQNPSCLGINTDSTIYIKNRARTTNINLKDMVLDKEKLEIIDRLLPMIHRINVAGSYMSGCLICSQDDVLQYFKNPSLKHVSGVPENKIEFFMLLNLNKSHNT